MRWATYLILALAVSSSSALESQSSGKRLFELMKCTSLKHGTLWASFGHQYRSDHPEPIYFPTEIVVFAPDLSSRLLFPRFDDGLKIPVDVRATGISMSFAVPKGVGYRNHVITLVPYGDLEGAFLGNWSVADVGQPEVSDQIACTIH